ncbi:MAG: superfamily protein-like exporter [Marmoricola sp.]|nr:superfamily protein-like exporter [Marmoricola sp.]
MTTSKSPTGSGRRPLTPLVGALLVVVVCALAGVGVGLSKVRIDSGTDAFLPAHDPVVTAMDKKAESFGGDPIIVLLQSPGPRQLLDGDQLVRLVELEGKLAQLDDVAAVYGPGTVLNQTAATAQNLLAQISGRRDGLRNQVLSAALAQGDSKRQATAKANATIAAFDERYGSLIVQGLPAGLPTLSNQQFVNTVMYGADLTPRPEWRFVLPRADMVSVLVRPAEGLDQAADARLVTAVNRVVKGAGLTLKQSTVTGVPVVAAALTQRARSELPLLGAISVGVVGLVFLLSPWSRRRRSRIRPLVAALVGTATTMSGFGWLGISVSVGVVAFLPILLGIGSDFPLYLSIGKRDRRVLVATLAAAAGFASLAISPLPFVRELGLALGIGLLTTAGSALALRWFFGPVEVREPARPASATRRGMGTGWRVVVGLVAVATAAIGWALLPGLTVQAQPEQLAQGLPEVTQAQYAESVLGSTGEVNVVLSGKNVATTQALAWSRRTESNIVVHDGDRVHPVISLADLFKFLGDDPTQAQVDAAVQLLPSYLTTAVLRADHAVGVIVLGVQFDDVGQLGPMLASIRHAAANPPAGTTVDVVGIPVAAVRGLDLVSQDRIWMNLFGIGLAGVVILLGLRSVRDALRTVATVLLATGWVALLAAVTSGTLSPLTVAIGSLTTATGVEFAIMLSAQRGAPAMRRSHVLTAAAAGTVGYLVLGASQLNLLRDFGLLLAAGVALSFLAALVVTEITSPTRSRADRQMPTVAARRHGPAALELETMTV